PPRPGFDGKAGDVSRRPLLSAESVSDPGACSAEKDAGYSETRLAFHQALCRANEQANRAYPSRDDGRAAPIPLARKRSGTAKLCRTRSDSFPSRRTSCSDTGTGAVRVTNPAQYAD